MKLTLEELAAWQMALRRQRPVGKLCVNGWWTRPWSAAIDTRRVLPEYAAVGAEACFLDFLAAHLAGGGDRVPPASKRKP